jgi:hypothetical protein
VALFAARYSGMRYPIVAFGLFATAKLFESFDYEIYSFCGLVSGHSLKHVTAGISCYWIPRMLQV